MICHRLLSLTQDQLLSAHCLASIGLFRVKLRGSERVDPMSFDFDSFAGALWTLSEAIDKTAGVVGISRLALISALRQQAIAKGDKWEASLWLAARSKTELGKWVYKQARNFNIENEVEILQLAKEIPVRIRRNLIEIAKRIPASRGGKPPALDSIQRWRVRTEVRKLHESGVPKDKAYNRVAKRMSVSAHTVRRICDKRERERTKQASRKIAFLSHQI